MRLFLGYDLYHLFGNFFDVRIVSYPLQGRHEKFHTLLLKMSDLLPQLGLGKHVEIGKVAFPEQFLRFFGEQKGCEKLRGVGVLGVLGNV